MRKIVVAFDHAGVDLKDVVIKTVKECGYEVIDVGTDSHTEADFPDYAYAGSRKILDKEAEKGIFVCGSGIGMCLAANKIRGIYAGVAHDCYTAHQAVEHDNINVLCLGSRVIGSEVARDLIHTFLNAKFNNKPNQVRRMDKVRQIENNTFELKNNSMCLYEFGQSVWLDNLQRGLIKNGLLNKDIERGLIRGITSNPSKFYKAITETRDYENALLPMALANVSAEDIYTQLIVEDIRDAADMFRNVFVSSGGNDGFVCLEISPLLAHDAEKTVIQAKSLWKAVNRPNLMIKIPVTDESLEAITELTAGGVNLNLTLIFSPERYAGAANAYIAGLRRRIENGESIEKVSCVASVFVSRIDSRTDSLLSEKGVSSRDFLGKTAIRNAQKIYNDYLKLFSDENIGDIKAHNGKPQKILWASTGTKNPLYKQAYYVEALIGKNTVAAVSYSTLEAVLKCAGLEPGLPVNDAEITEYFSALEKTGIDMSLIYERLEIDGLAFFINDYEATLSSIRSYCGKTRSNLGLLEQEINKVYEKFEQESIIRRIFSKDPTVWTFDTTAFPEIRNRLGWLDTYKTTEKSIPDYTALRNELKKDGITKILLLGMGGSSLAPAVISDIFEDELDIRLQILDSADPIQVLKAGKEHDPRETLYIVSSKSGITAEVKACLDYFYDRAYKTLEEKTGSHFIAVTDYGTTLENTARELGFRRIFPSDPSVGGRFSALTAFGILPAILIGLDPQLIGEKVKEIMQYCSPSLPVHRNEGAALGSFIGTAAACGKDKLTIVTDPEFKSFGNWIEHLIAESTGKEGKGIIPIINEPELNGKQYANDRAFVYINCNNSQSDKISAVREQGHPVFEISIDNRYDLFAEFYRWEIAVSVACAVLNINAFDQPGAQDGKNRIIQKIADYQEKGKLEDLTSEWACGNVEVWADASLAGISSAGNYNEIITCFLADAKPGINYIALNAFLPRSEEIISWLQKLRDTILQSTGCATTVGFGPAFLHLTGQLHREGPDSGYFIQIVTDHNTDTDIPHENLSFGILERAQSIADFESLRANGRKIIRILFKNGVPVQE